MRLANRSAKRQRPGGGDVAGALDGGKGAGVQEAGSGGKLGGVQRVITTRIANVGGRSTGTTSNTIRKQRRGGRDASETERGRL